MSEDLEVVACKAAGNWKEFESFGWHYRPEDAENWMIVYTHNRDSNLLDVSNAIAIKAIICDSAFDDDVRQERHGHWACGWIEGYAIRVFSAQGQVTPAFAAWREIEDSLSDYPVLDESDYSSRQYEAALEWIRIEGRAQVANDAPSIWPAEVFSWLWENDQSELEEAEYGACPSHDAIAAALSAIGYLEAEDEEEESQEIEDDA